MADFAKLFNTYKHGQILVINDSDDSGDPAISFLFQPDGLGVCKLAVNFKSDAWDAADAYFDGATEEIAVSVVSKALAEGVIKELLNEESSDD